MLEAAMFGEVDRVDGLSCRLVSDKPDGLVLTSDAVNLVLLCGHVRRMIRVLCGHVRRTLDVG